VHEQSVHATVNNHEQSSVRTGLRQLLIMCQIYYD